MHRRLNRRQFIKGAAGAAGGALLAHIGIQDRSMAASEMETRPVPLRRRDISGAQVAFVKTDDRTDGVSRALDLLGINPVQGKQVFVKPNYNSADPTPGSTHNDTLSALIARLGEMDANTITVGDRSGMGNTRQVMQQKGISDMAGALGFETLVFDDLTVDDWVLIQPESSHWQNGFPVARPVVDAESVVQACCLKTHRYGGHFTLSLKNSVGVAAKTVPGSAYNYMNELHGSIHQRRMIAEINVAYEPDLIVLDGVDAFVTGGPDTGGLVHPQVILAGTDRVAVDAVGVALLRYFGTTGEVSRGAIFEQEQIARAVELALGVDDPAKIELLTGDADSAAYAETIQAVLLEAA
ncbi:MAG: DUF362 domain-containing protein [Anaerolineae bacterium]|nr:DUF362 domain-containing protein [Anaerolineae bacterium]